MRRGMLVMLVLLAGCSSASSPAVFGSSTTDGGTKTTAPTGGFSTSDAGAPITTSNQAGCDDSAKLVYVLSFEGDMYSFAPADKKFTKIGAIDCGGDLTGYEPISMAVDRNTVAWMKIRAPDNSNAAIVKYDINAKTCTRTKVTGLTGGMAFASDGTSTTADTLYVTGDSSIGGGLSKIDTTAEKLLPIANFATQAGEDTELTGTGDGRLLGFFVGSDMSFATMDKTTATIGTPTSLSAITPPESPLFAFSFWGGDFYFYTSPALTPGGSTVAHYTSSSGKLDTAYMTNIGFHITGAGVSTCAPTTSSVK